MKKINILLFIIAIAFCANSDAIQTISNFTNTVYHNMFYGLDYDNSGHSGFARSNGDSSNNFTSSNFNASGTLTVSGNIPTFIYPNNASFTLTGLSEKNWNSIQNKPSTMEGYGIEGIATETTITQHTNATSSIHGITNPLLMSSYSSHVGSWTAHGANRILTSEMLIDINIDFPWN